MYTFCIGDTWEHVSMHWHQRRFQLWANCFICWKPVANPGPQSLIDNSATNHGVEWPPITVSSVITIRPWPAQEWANSGHDRSIRNGLALVMITWLVVQYHTPSRTTRRFWTATILHLAAYTWHWHTDIFLYVYFVFWYGWGMRKYLGALTAG